MAKSDEDVEDDSEAMSRSDCSLDQRKRVIGNAECGLTALASWWKLVLRQKGVLCRPRGYPIEGMLHVRKIVLFCA